MTRKIDIKSLTDLQEKLTEQNIGSYQAFCLNLGIKQKQLVVTEFQKLKDNIVI